MAEIYLKPEKYAALAYNDDKQFIKVMQENGIKDFSVFIGYEMSP